MKIQKYIETNCADCAGRYSCCDLSGDLIEEQVVICMEKNSEAKNERT